MIGEISALISALCWASSSVMLKSQTSRVNPISINILRCISALGFLILFLSILGKLQLVNEFSLYSIIGLTFSASFGLGLGDTLNLKSMGMIGVSRAFPITSIYPLFTMIIAFLFLNEDLTWFILLGALFILGGVYLVATPSRRKLSVDEIEPATLKRGVLMSLGAALFWSLSVAILKIFMENLDPLVTNIVRLPAIILLLWIFYPQRNEVFRVKRYNRNSLLIIAVGGIIGMGIGGILFLIGVKNAGAAKTTVLTSLSPFFAIIFSLLFLKEKVTLRIILGSILSIIGVWFVV